MNLTKDNLPEFINPLHHDEFLPPISPWLTLVVGRVRHTEQLLVLLFIITCDALFGGQNWPNFFDFEL